MKEINKKEYKNPAPVIDVIIEIADKIVLIERRGYPSGFALPGGFVDYGESLESAAVREALEETNLHVKLTDLLYVYSNPLRDPRMHTITSVFIAKASGVPKGGDDAKYAFTVSLDDLPDRFVFDHANIVKDYIRFRDTGERPEPKN